eukprot:scaffold20.g7620.t1
MGCTQSRPESELFSPMARESAQRRGPHASMAGAFRQDESSKDPVRLLTSGGTRAAPLPAGGTLRYAFVSQRGFYPDQPDKANQDAVVAAERLGGAADCHLFCVFDGHGECGTECAQFATDKMPVLLAKDKSLAAAPEAALRAAMLATNTQLHRALIDDSLSGTTACALLLAGRTAHVANVGDSRAVLAQRQPGGRLLARDLEDERMRVQRAGARVLTLDQLEGIKDPAVQCWTCEDDCDGDPPRLWSPYGMFPGTAFTRSIGDAAAEEIGVCAEPEISTTRLGADTPFAVVATDGVWEFISSQRAVDIVQNHDSPFDAAKAIVATAYKLWLQKETRTDDITAAVLFFDGLAGGSAGGSAPATAKRSSSGVALTAVAR